MPISLNEKLGLILLPTEKCNLRCSYCYEDFACGRMSASTISGIGQLIRSRAPKLKQLHVSWFGGEPLMVPEIISEISSQAIDLLADKYRSSMTTNGTLLTPENFRLLENSQIGHLQITLDGVGGRHDCARISPSGRGGFDRIIENLWYLKTSRHQIDVTLRLHSHASDNDRLTELVDFVIAQFANDKRFSAIVQPILDFSSNSVQSKPGCDCPLTFLSAARERLRATFQSAPPRQSSSTCYAAMPNSLVIRSNGHIAKCTVALQSDLNDVGQINEDGTLSINQEKFQHWVRGLFNDNPAELRCPRNLSSISSQIN